MSGLTIAKIQNLSKSFVKLKALNSISMQLQAGKVISVLGPNGAGKTTLINLMLGRLAPDQGEIDIFGYQPGDINLKRLCGAMLQISNLPETLTIREHIELFQSYYAEPMSYQKVISLAGLENIENRKSKDLSGGQKQRLLFALSICGNPKLLFLDEPSVGMDVSARKSLWLAIESLKKEGTSIVLTTHYLEEADQLSDEIIMLNQGRIIHQGTPESIKAKTQHKKIRFTSNLEPHQFAALVGVIKVEKAKDLIEVQSNTPEKTLREIFSITSDIANLSVSGALLEDAFIALNESHQQQEKTIQNI
ncbi:MAG: ABC transporter ATP-binding protein [Kangiellaceae bacterium]|nr:ABC transporter ATP-binding protein [Kangiellaceae bacterium]